MTRFATLVSSMNGLAAVAGAARAAEPQTGYDPPGNPRDIGAVHQREEFAPTVGLPRQDDVARGGVAGNEKFFPLKATGSAQADSLTAAVLEELGDFSQRRLLNLSVYTKNSGARKARA
jgi:hypothetical protein